VSETRRMLDLAARLALMGAGRVEPNPMVGAVLVKEGKVVGLGHHRRFGHLHAEREAIANCRKRGLDPRGSTLYVTLEPCRHFGKQPPCTDAIVEAGIARVIYAREDPGEVSGGGAAILQAKGIPCELSKESPLATGISDPFVKRIKTGLPWVAAKWAQTIDGRIATRTGESKWISGELARRRVHRLRGRVDAVLTGIGTALADDPMLTARDVPIRRTAKRVIADTDLDLPPNSNLARTAHDVPTIVACDAALLTSELVKSRREALTAQGVQLLGIPPTNSATGRTALDLRALLTALGRDHAVATVLVEAGPGLLGALFEHDLIDEAIVYTAPMLLGDDMAKSVAVGRVAEHLSAARRFKLWRAKSLGGDIEVTYRKP
jgi:diaminohydroxyphosphoribosylaminopyrimidine deaminase / 5-amino-6-(5-phosphoribosylamino)uracil reductase